VSILDLGPMVEQMRGADALTCVGGRTQWNVGGSLSIASREVRAPVGIVSYEPAEMTVRVGAGTTLDELHDILGRAGQTTALEGRPGATIGGLLAVGHDGIRSRRVGRARDVLLQARVVLADGRVVTAGGPTVKNVTGFDLCRLLVGSLGTLGFVGEVIVRTRPRPRASVWLAGPAEPTAVDALLHRPASVLWDGCTTWVLLEGYERDVEAQAALLAPLGVAPAGAPVVPDHLVRSSVTPSELLTRGRAAEPGSFIGEIGVGVVHAAGPWSAPAVCPAAIATLHARITTAFDPTGRLNPGRGRATAGALS
jgi:FAD/FMN-containing dehydrogenase